MKEPRVLIIDDDPMISELLQHQLSDHGCQVLRAHMGEAGLEIMRSHPVDFVITDFMMPILNGMEFTRVLKSRPEWADTKVVFISAADNPEHRQRALSLGALDYLPKSLGPEALVAKVMAHIGPASATPSPAAPEPASAVALRLQRIELLATHLLEVLELTGLDPQLSEPTARALGLARSKAEEIGAAARGETANAPEAAPSPAIV